jgi:hypothetical protein
VNPSTLLTFADDLSIYQLGDIDKALMVMASVPRRDGETAFPEVATIREAIRGVKRGRAERSAIDKENARIAHFKAHPELYETSEELKAMTKRIEEKFSFDAPRREIEIQHREESCPHCQGVLPIASNIRFWSSEELRNLADVVQKNEQIAAANRARCA